MIVKQKKYMEKTSIEENDELDYKEVKVRPKKIIKKPDRLDL